VDLTVYLQRIR